MPLEWGSSSSPDGITGKKRKLVMARAKIILEDCTTVAEWMAKMYIVKEA